MSRLLLHTLFYVMSFMSASTLGLWFGVRSMGDNPGALFGVFAVFIYTYLLLLGIEFIFNNGLPYLWKFKTVTVKSFFNYVMNGLLRIVSFFIAMTLSQFIYSLFYNEYLLFINNGWLQILLVSVSFLTTEFLINHFVMHTNLFQPSQLNHTNNFKTS